VSSIYTPKTPEAFNKSEIFYKHPHWGAQMAELGFRLGYWEIQGQSEPEPTSKL